MRTAVSAFLLSCVALSVVAVASGCAADPSADNTASGSEDVVTEHTAALVGTYVAVGKSPVQKLVLQADGFFTGERPAANGTKPDTIVGEYGVGTETISFRAVGAHPKPQPIHGGYDYELTPTSLRLFSSPSRQFFAAFTRVGAQSTVGAAPACEGLGEADCASAATRCEAIFQTRPCATGMMCPQVEEFARCQTRHL
jgi:hypothetical protein